MPGSKVKLADFGLAVECEKNHKEYFGEWTCTEGDKKRDGGTLFHTCMCAHCQWGGDSVCQWGGDSVCQWGGDSVCQWGGDSVCQWGGDSVSVG